MLPLKTFSNFVVRTPIYPINILLEDLDVNKLRTLCNSSIIQEAVYLASKPLYIEMIKFCKDSNFNNEKVILSLLKYITRLSSRCTPFGLFSGCSIGSFSKETRLYRSALRIRRRTSIDNLLLGSLILDYESESKSEISYFPNNSKYLVGEQLRYTEYYYTNNSKFHFLSAIENTEILDEVFKFCSDGKNEKEITDFIYQQIRYEVSKEGVSEYVFELINNKILVSDLSPVIIGKKNTLEYLIDKTKIGEFNKLLVDIKEILNKIDTCSYENNQMQHYISLENKIKRYGKTDDIRSHVFQSDILIDFDKVTIDYQDCLGNIPTALRILNKLSQNYIVSRIESFKKRFYERYENRKVSLALVLDTEIGIKYGDDKDYDLSAFVDDIKDYVGSSSHLTGDMKLSKADCFLLQKIFSKDSDIVTLEVDDIVGFNEDWDDVADTFSIMCSLHEDIVSLKFVGGTSASCLLGRFGYLEDSIEGLINEIYLKEEIEDKIVAEIVHLPEDRTGNILYRYNTRKYEIPYLGMSSKGIDHQFLIDDLLVYVENDQIKIRSKRLNKEVVPKLSNAHYFSSTLSVPIYQFLCDLQMQNLKVNMTLNMSNILNVLRYIPRIQHKNVVLSERQWILNKEEINELIKKNDFINFLSSKGINNNFYLVDGDNELYINIQNDFSIKMFTETIKNREFVHLKESLYCEFSSEIKDSKSNIYANEVILSYYKMKDEKRNNE